MRHSDRFRLVAFAVALVLAGCKPDPVLEPKPTPAPTLSSEVLAETSAAPAGETPAATPLPETVVVVAATPSPVLPPPSPAPSVPEEEKPAIVLPPPPPLTAAGKALLLSSAGRTLVLEFETGGRSGYDPHPEWPGGASGVTVGIGYDCGYYSPKVIMSDWSVLKSTDRTRLAGTSGLTGQKARAKRLEVKDIFVAWAIATDVFDRVDVAREYSNAKRAVPGFEDLRPNAQAAWISLGFNRGWQMSGPNRTEMRAARDFAPKRDYEGMARQFVKMKRVWTGTSIQNGMYRRRDAEAKLLLTP